MRWTITPYTLTSTSILSFYTEVLEMGELGNTYGKRRGAYGVLVGKPVKKGHLELYLHFPHIPSLHTERQISFSHYTVPHRHHYRNSYCCVLYRFRGILLLLLRYPVMEYNRGQKDRVAV
jgi:hypothetical protein